MGPYQTWGNDKKMNVHQALHLIGLYINEHGVNMTTRHGISTIFVFQLEKLPCVFVTKHYFSSIIGGSFGQISAEMTVI